MRNKRFTEAKDFYYSFNNKEWVDLIFNILSKRFISMKQRCYNNKSKDYKNYGGRGIKICDEWLENNVTFIEWALNNGFEKTLHIDRKDNNGNYEPTNCHFITLAENNRNMRRQTVDPDLLYKAVFGEFKDLSAGKASKLLNISRAVIWRNREKYKCEINKYENTRIKN